MEQTPKQFYTYELEEEGAAQLVVNGHMGVTVADRCLSLSPQILCDWIAKHRDWKALTS